MRKVPRHLFLEEALLPQAYANHPVPIGHSQTISQPYVVAWMTELLAVTPGQRVLEIGTGSGYQTAILAELGALVFTVERVRDLSLLARRRLEGLRYRRVQFKIDDGTMSAKEETFEKALERLERIAARLEAGDVPLEKSVALYKEGMTIVAECRKRLEAARLEVALAGEDGAVRPFEAEGEGETGEVDGDG